MLQFRNAGSSKLTKTFSKRIFNIKLLYLSLIVRTLCPCLLSAQPCARIIFVTKFSSYTIAKLHTHTTAALLYTLLPTRQRHRHSLTARSCPNYSACLHCTGCSPHNTHNTICLPAQQLHFQHILHAHAHTHTRHDNTTCLQSNPSFHVYTFHHATKNNIFFAERSEDIWEHSHGSTSSLLTTPQHSSQHATQKTNSADHCVSFSRLCCGHSFALWIKTKTHFSCFA